MVAPKGDTPPSESPGQHLNPTVHVIDVSSPEAMEQVCDAIHSMTQISIDVMGIPRTIYLFLSLAAQVATDNGGCATCLSQEFKEIILDLGGTEDCGDRE